ncbi:MAG: hypothetical protein ABH952_11965 [Candidatus Omnitrophota bacterium]
MKAIQVKLQMTRHFCHNTLADLRFFGGEFNPCRWKASASMLGGH